MSKKKNLNTHKGPTEHQSYQSPRFCPYKKPRNKKTKVKIVALDSNILIDMERVYMRRPDAYLTAEYRKNLINLYGLFKSGKICFCITPTVKEEVTDNNPNLHEFLYDILDKSIMLEINSNERRSFEKSIGRLVTAYSQSGLFVGQDNDSHICAESAFFNINLITHDNHFNMIERVVNVNKKHLPFGDVKVAHPIKSNDFMKIYKNGGISSLAEPQNLDILDSNTQEKFERLGYITKETVEVELVPTKRGLKTNEGLIL